MQPFLKVLVLFGALASYEAATVCLDPIGVGDSSKINDQSFTATSSDGNHLPHLARYNNVNKDAWCAAKIGDSITVQLGKLYRINRVTVEGLQTGNGSYITSYKLKYSYHGAIFDYLVPLKGPQSKDDLKVEDLLQDIVIADAVTLIPQTFKNKPCLRFELFGCGYVEPPTPPPVVPTTKFDACKVKNGGCEHNCDTVLSKAVCSCRSGFILDADKQSCNVDHCMKNNGGCQDTCTSSKTGPVCGCNAGYKLDASKKNCTDINECLRGTDSCNKDKSACFNTEGSYTCICKRGYKPSGHGSKVCVDINECSSTGFAKNGNCSQECKNIDGAYRCACHDGYFLNRDGRTCNDIDECAQKTDVCVKRKSVCHNTPGSYQCICKPGFEPKSPGSRVCVDIDECSMTKFPVNGNCSQICENFQGFHRCKCHAGYFLEKDGRTCTDIDECKTNNPCNTTLSTCINEVPGYHCKCGDGLVNKPGDKDKCIDKDECAFNKGGCDHNCHNTYRSYYCSCRAHYYLGDDHKTCHDVDECAVNNGGCQQICNNFDGGYSCQCNAGYTLATKDYKTCDDIDECQDGFNGGCQKYCNNTIGSYHCYCDPGFKVVNGKQCEDIDECAIGTHKCNTATSICKNLRTGSYRCDCLAGFTKNAQTGACEASSCASASPQPINGYAEPARCATPGGNIFRQTCTFKCNQGYQLTSSSAIGAFCDNSGYWTMTQGKDSPRCEPIRCNPLTPVANAFLSPPECATKGAQYTNKCLMYCQKNSANLVGKRFVTCQIDGTYDGDFSTTKCVQRPRISCPADIEEVLPLGQSSMKIEIGKINTNVAAKYLTSLPAGVLTGTYRFKHGYNSVRLIAKNELGEQDQCSFVVQIRDKEPPKVFDCDSDNQHININGKQAVVTWKEPRFTDNSGLLAKPVPSIKNGEQRAAQIYYVSYTAQDIAGNRASCNFFVHVHEKFCDTTLRHNRQIFPFGGSSYMIICGAKRFTKPVIGANVPNFARVQCSKGVWTPAELPGCTNFQTKTGDCPAGTQAVKISIHEYCSNCPAGKYNDVASGTCKNCEIGKYQDKEGQQSCNSCPQYSTTRFQGSTSKSDCKVLCDKGSYSKDGMRDLTTGCQKCPYGSFQDLNGKTECKICPEGGNTTASGSTDVSQCHAAAMITKVVPTEEVYNGFVGDNVTIECYAKGSPVPYLTINSKTTLAPANERGTQSQMPLPTNSKYVTGRKLSIINAQVKDTATYACVAQNQKGSGMAVDTRLIRVAIEQRAPASV